MGPKKAAEAFVKRASDADRYKVTLYGSLAATGKGHMTDVAILSVLEPVAPTEIVWRPDISLPFHPNGMRFEAFKAGKPVDEWVIYSVGGGALANEETAKNPPANIYPMTHISEILEWCNREGQTFWEYVEECEGPGIWDYLDEIWTAMCETIVRGLTAEGVLPGGLKVSRKASTYLVKAESYTDTLRSRAKLYAYALATAEENASGGTVVTAPTCGSSAVMPAVLYHLVNTRNFSRLRILRALATGGLFGNVAKTNSSISGAEVGCQGEVGVACAMAAYGSNDLRFWKNEYMCRRAKIAPHENKHNGQKQKEHLEEARAIRDIRQHRKGTNWWDGGNRDGAPTKRDEIRAYAVEHPEASQRAIAKALGVSPTTVNKWLKPDASPATRGGNDETAADIESLVERAIDKHLSLLIGKHGEAVIADREDYESQQSLADLLEEAGDWAFDRYWERLAEKNGRRVCRVSIQGIVDDFARSQRPKTNG